jgi:hypothetical protein
MKAILTLQTMRCSAYEGCQEGGWGEFEMLAGARRAGRESDGFLGRLTQGGTRTERV